jgi:hypothetical protein
MEPESARYTMVRDQLRRRGIHDRRVLEAMQTMPRDAFVLPELIDEAYADRALPIECGQTISQPFIVALMTEALDECWRSARGVAIRRPSSRDWPPTSFRWNGTPSWQKGPARR